jgi:hypothetical protein
VVLQLLQLTLLQVIHFTVLETQVTTHSQLTVLLVTVFTVLVDSVSLEFTHTALHRYFATSWKDVGLIQTFLLQLLLMKSLK